MARCQMCKQLVPTMAIAQLHVAGACMYDPHFWDWGYVYVDRDRQLWAVKRLKGQGSYVRTPLDDAELAPCKLTKDAYLTAAAAAVIAPPPLRMLPQGMLVGPRAEQPENMSHDYFKLCKRDGWWPLRGLKANPAYKTVQAVSAKLGADLVNRVDLLWEPFTGHEPWQAIMWGDCTVVFPELPQKPPHLNSLMAMPDPVHDAPVVSFSHLDRVQRARDTAHYVR